MVKKWQHLIQTGGMLVLISLIVMMIAHLFVRDRIVCQYMSLPFWILVCLSLFVTASYLLGMVRLRITFSTILLSLILIVTGGFMGYREVICPLLDASYVEAPYMIHLDNLHFYSNNMADSVVTQLTGDSQEGEQVKFDISYEAYEEGEKLYEQVKNKNGYDVAADIEYLPYSKMITGMNMWIEK